MHRSFLCLLLMLAVAAGATPTHGKQLYSLVRIDAKDAAEVDHIRSLGIDVVRTGEGYLEAVIERNDLRAIEDAGLSYEIKIDDMAGFYRERLQQASKDDYVGSMGGYRTLSEIYLAMDSISSENPSIVTPKWSIGQTLEGRPIYVIKVSDNPDIDEDEPEVYFNAAIHAREVITPELLIRFLRYLTSNYGTDPKVTALVNSREMFFTLCQNPDGYYHNEVTDPGGGGMWRKNRRNNGDGSFGIDLNRNYGYMWGYDDAGSSPNGHNDTYRGTGPFSEPETQVVRDFVISRNFSLVVSYHSYTPYIEWPWAYNCSPSEDNTMLNQVGAWASQYNNYNYSYMCGINGCSGDWYYGDLSSKPRIIEILVEVGWDADGFWPDPSRITPLVEENIQPNMIYAEFGGNHQMVLPPSPPVLQSIGDVTLMPLVLEWSHTDSANPAVGFDVWQYGNLSRVTDDMEVIGEDWALDGFRRTLVKRHSGQYSYWSTNTASREFTFTCVSTLSVQPNDSITFWAWYDTDPNWSYAYVEVYDSASGWVSVPGNLSTTSDPNGMNEGNGITGSSGGWVRGVFDISAFSGRSINYRFRYVTGDLVKPGFYIDDVYPLDRYLMQTRIAQGHPDTTLTISHLSNGLYYFQIFSTDAQNQTSAGSAIREARVDAALCGDADGSGGVDIGDPVYLINFIFAGGAVPDPVEAGDADCSGGIDIGDVVYLINFIFSGGYAPGDINGDGVPDC